ncbi:uncharacterized protein J3R85_000151 [Psidium guajava]|nr:uncharacterized protein J3R85_000151 [Psidium guajava]
MSSHVVSLLSNFVVSLDGAVLGLTLACAAVRTIMIFTSSSSALRKLQDAPVVGTTKLRSMLSVLDGSDSEPDSWSRSGREEFVVLRGWVMPKYEVEPGVAWDIVKEPVFKVQGYRGNVVISQRTHVRRTVMDFFLLKYVVVFV